MAVTPDHRSNPPRILSPTRTQELIDALRTGSPIRFCELGWHGTHHNVEITYGPEQPAMAHFEPCGNSAYLNANQEDQ